MDYKPRIRFAGHPTPRKLAPKALSTCPQNRQRSTQHHVQAPTAEVELVEFLRPRSRLEFQDPNSI